MVKGYRNAVEVFGSKSLNEILISGVDGEINKNLAEKIK